MSRVPNETYPALRGLRELTYLPCADRKTGTQAGMMVLGNGYLFLVVSGFNSPFEALEKATASMEQALLGLTFDGPIDISIYEWLKPWAYDVPAQIEEMAESWGFELTGLPFMVPLPVDTVYKCLIQDASVGRVKLVLPPLAATLLGCSRQNIHCRLKTKSLTPILLRDMSGLDGPRAARNTTYCLMSEIMSERDRLVAKGKLSGGEPHGVA